MPKVLFLLFILGALSLFPIRSQTTNAAPTTVANPAASAMSRGVEAASHGDLDAGIAAFTDAIKADPTLVTAYINRGRALAMQKKFADALADFDKAIQLDPKNQEAYFRRGSIKGEKSDFDGALADFNQVITLGPGNAVAFYSRGHVKYFKGDLKGAMEDLNQAITLDPKFAPSYWLRGVVHLAQAEPNPALDDFKASLNAGFAYGAFWQWIVQMQNGDRAAATSSLSSSAANTQLFKPDDWPASIAAFLTGKITQDQLVAKAGTGGDDANAQVCEAWFYIGVNNQLQGNAAAAKDNFQKAIDTKSTGSEEIVEAQRQLTHLQSN